MCVVDRSDPGTIPFESGSPDSMCSGSIIPRRARAAFIAIEEFAVAAQERRYIVRGALADQR